VKELAARDVRRNYPTGTIVSVTKKAWALHPPKSMATGVVKRLWANRNRRCVLSADGEWLELRLYERGHLVGLCVCPSVERALELALVWYDHPPTWPPFSEGDAE
jgi:hypothetical protein